MFSPLFLVAMGLNMVAAWLTIQFAARLTTVGLNAEGIAAVEGLPSDVYALINSPKQAVRLLVILYRREYLAFGNPAVAQVGNRALLAQAIALPVMLWVMASGA